MTLKASNYPTIRPSLDLNFAQTKRLDPRITFSRASTGTYFDANGVLQSAPAGVARFDHNPVSGESLGLLVEEARTNSLNYSQYLTSWILPFTTAVVTSNTGMAPDGTWTATSYVPSSGSSHIRQGLSSGTVTASVYAKSNGLSIIRFGALGSGGYQQFNLSTATVGSGVNVTSASIQACGNNWYRCTATWTQSANNTFFIDYSGSPEVLDGIKGLFIWGAQLEAGSFPTSYIPTPATFTGRASTATYYDASGVIQTAASGVARDDAYFPDENGVMRPAGLLLEEAGTNTIVHSNNFDTATTPWRYTQPTPNSGTAPDGTNTAWLLEDGRIEYDNIVTTNRFSIFVKKGTARYIDVAFGTNAIQPGAIFDLDTETILGYRGNSPIGSNGTIQKLPNGWYRLSVADSSSAARRVSIGISTVWPFNVQSGPWSGTAYIWGAQREISSLPTSYIPTAGSQVTRAADTSTSATVTRSADVAQITGSNFSSWYRQDEGTVFCQGISDSRSNSAYWTTSNGGSNGATVLVYPANNITYQVVNSSIQVNTTFATYSAVASVKTAAAIKLNNFAVVANGGAITSDTSGTVPNVTSFGIGSYLGGGASYDYSGTISRLTYYPVRLPDATLQTITAP